MRQSAIDISLNAARLNAQTRACSEMSKEQLQQADGLAQRSEQIAAMSEQTAASARDIAVGFHAQTEVAEQTLEQLKILNQRIDEIITDISIPVDIDGQRWGAVRIGVDYLVYDGAMAASPTGRLNGHAH